MECPTFHNEILRSGATSHPNHERFLIEISQDVGEVTFHIVHVSKFNVNFNFDKMPERYSSKRDCPSFKNTTLAKRERQYCEET